MSSEKPLSSQFWISYCAIHPTFYEVRGYQRWELQVFWKETTRSVSAKLREKLACVELRQPSQGEKSETFSSGFFLSFVAKKMACWYRQNENFSHFWKRLQSSGGEPHRGLTPKSLTLSTGLFSWQNPEEKPPSFFQNPNIQKSPLSPVANLFTLIYVLLCFLIDLFKRYHYQNLCLHVYKETKNTHTKQWSLKSSHAAKKTRLILAQAPGLLQLKPQILQLRDLLSLTRILHFHWWNIHLRRHCRGLYRSRRLTRLTQRTTRGRFHWRFYRRGLFGRSLKSNGFFLLRIRDGLKISKRRPFYFVLSCSVYSPILSVFLKTK